MDNKLKHFIEKRWGKSVKAFHPDSSAPDPIIGTIEFEDGTHSSVSVEGPAENAPEPETQNEEEEVSGFPGFLISLKGSIVLLLAIGLMLVLVNGWYQATTEVDRVSKAVYDIIHNHVGNRPGGSEPRFVKNEFTDNITHISKTENGRDSGTVHIYTESERVCTEFLQADHDFSSPRQKVSIDVVYAGVFLVGQFGSKFIDHSRYCQKVVDDQMAIAFSYTKQALPERVKIVAKSPWEQNVVFAWDKALEKMEQETQPLSFESKASMMDHGLTEERIKSIRKFFQDKQSQYDSMSRVELEEHLEAIRQYWSAD